MRRRDLIILLGGAAAWPLAARAQVKPVRRIGVVIGSTEKNPETTARLAAFRQGLQERGWSESRNVSIDYRFALDSTDQFQAVAKELVALQPDVIFAHSTPIVAALQRESRTIPTVFVSVSDPIGEGFIANLARPGGNHPGVLLFEAGIVGKWMAMLKQIAPRLMRVALMANPKTTAYDYFLRSAEAAKSSLAVELSPSHIETATDIERAIESFAHAPNMGLAVLPDNTNNAHRDLIIALTAKHRLPTVYTALHQRIGAIMVTAGPFFDTRREKLVTLAAHYAVPTMYHFREFAAAGGLISYGIDARVIYRQIGVYAGAILKGDRPAELPVLLPTKFELVINLKTAKALGIRVPLTLQVAADEVIE
jgi:putative ABC transport system substrate-binding protein